jgi:hypothetical protein
MSQDILLEFDLIIRSCQKNKKKQKTKQNKTKTIMKFIRLSSNIIYKHICEIQVDMFSLQKTCPNFCSVFSRPYCQV